MSGIIGSLGLNDNDRSFVSTLGQTVVFEAIQAEVDKHRADVAAATSVFVGEVTSDFKRRFKLPGGGFLQKLGKMSPSANVKASGYWDIALPLEDYGAAIGGDRVSLAYLTAQELNRHLDTIFIQDYNTRRLEILKALFNNTVFTFVDEIHGSLSVQPLANNDAVVYPPVIGATAEAADNHYLYSGYAATAIDDSHNPFPTMRDALTQHFGAKTNGDNIVVFINVAEEPEVEDLTDFDAVSDRFVIPGANVDQLTGLPANIPGRVIGRTNDCWISVWDHVPANYMLGIYLEPSVPKPLIERIDPTETGLPVGLSLIKTSDQYPLENSYYSDRFGYGVGNRLNGVVMFLTSGSAYTIPTAYAR